MRAPLADVHITGDIPEDNVDYSLMVDVALNEVREKKGTGDENPDKTFIFIPTGDIRLINLKKINERSHTAEGSGTENRTELADELGSQSLAEGKTAGVQN